jgi:hypothetical protein
MSSHHWWLSLVLGGGLAAFVSCVGIGGGDGSSEGSEIPEDEPDAESSGSIGSDGNGFMLDPDALVSGDATTGFDEDACAADAVDSQLTPVNLIFIIDKSGSMGDDADGDWFHLETRWNPVKEAVLAFFEEPGSTHLFASLDFFPAEGGIEVACDPAEYKPPRLDVRLTSLEEVQRFIDELEGITPSGGTPTWPAVRGSLDYAMELTEADPNSRSVVVLVTDGQPGLMSVPIDDPAAASTMKETCYEYGHIDVPNDMYEVADIVQDAHDNHNIDTYVVGMHDGERGSEDFVNDLNDVARAGSGGNREATIVTDQDPALTRNTLQSLLTSIRSSYLSCKMPVPEAEEGAESVDFGKVNVTIEMNGQQYALVKVQGCLGGLGWQYLYDNQPANVPPDEKADPVGLELCESTCATVQGNAGVRLIVELGCVSRVPE